MPQNLKISIVTPAYKRPLELIRAVKSVIIQEYKNWEMIIINDSPDFDFSIFTNFLEEEYKKDKDLKNKIKYFINDKNRGGNYSRNFGIDNISSDSDFVFFLDHDDWLADTSLKDQIQIVKREKCDWLLTINKSNDKDLNIDSIKIIKEDEKYYNYLNDYLIKRKIRGDYAQLLSSPIIKNNKIYYSKKLTNKSNQWEEWIFSMKYSRYSRFYLKNIITLEKEYQTDSLTTIVNTKKDFKNKWLNFKNTCIVINEVLWDGFYPMEKIYLLIKFLRAGQKLLF